MNLFSQLHLHPIFIFLLCLAISELIVDLFIVVINALLHSFAPTNSPYFQFLNQPSLSRPRIWSLFHFKFILSIFFPHLTATMRTPKNKEWLLAILYRTFTYWLWLFGVIGLTLFLFFS